MNKMIIRVPKFKISYSLIINLLLSIFFITKMIRSFSGSLVAGGVWNYIQIIIILLGCIIIIKNLVKLCNEPIFVFLLIYTIVAMFNGMFFLEFTVNKLYNYAMIAYPICMFALVFNDRYCRYEKNNIIKVTFYVISIIFILSMVTAGVYSTSTGAVADVYYILSLLPIVMMYSKSKGWLPCMICGLAVAISSKRAGIILFIVMIVAFYTLNLVNSKNKKKYIGTFIKISLTILAFIITIYMIDGIFNDHLIYKLQKMLYDYDSAGRDVLWNKTLIAMDESSFIHWIIGHGDGAVTSAIGKNAHNDFLEILYNFGLIACVSYLAFHLYCIYMIFKMIKSKYQYVAYYTMTVICSLGLAMVSFYVIAPTYITSGMLCLSYFLYNYRKRILL